MAPVLPVSQGSVYVLAGPGERAWDSAQNSWDVLYGPAVVQLDAGGLLVNTTATGVSHLHLFPLSVSPR